MRVDWTFPRVKVLVGVKASLRACVCALKCTQGPSGVGD